MREDENGGRFMIAVCRASGARRLRLLAYPALAGWASFCRAAGACLDMADVLLRLEIDVGGVE